MSAEDNKAITRRLSEAWNQGNADLLDELLAPNFAHHAALTPNLNREEYKAWLRDTRAAFPDLHLTTEDEIADEKQVVARWSFRGTHQHDLVSVVGTIPPTGKQIMTTGITIFRIADGKVAEDWHAADDVGFLQQLGVIPMPAQATAG